MTAGKDPRTYDIAQAIMQEEVEHEAWFIEAAFRRDLPVILGEGLLVSPHMYWGTREFNTSLGNSPCGNKRL